MAAQAQARYKFHHDKNKLRLQLKIGDKVFIKRDGAKREKNRELCEITDVLTNENSVKISKDGFSRIENASNVKRVKERVAENEVGDHSQHKRHQGTWFPHFSVRSKQFRYTLCANGEEELFDYEADPLEWKNLANDPRYAEPKEELRTWLPKTNAKHFRTEALDNR